MAFDSDDVIEDLAVTTADALVESGIKRPNANAIGYRVAEKIRGHWGGQNIYFTRGLTTKNRDRDQQIFNAFNGTNYDELAQQFGLSMMRVRQIVTKIQELRHADRAGTPSAKRN